MVPVVPAIFHIKGLKFVIPFLIEQNGCGHYADVSVQMDLCWSVPGEVWPPQQAALQPGTHHR